ncbi:hypothetical protein M422DRAFT_270046 [Sphaerobolus stellatus SS14]|uniref:SET domain-containing protein n=1 Tax=Sphaerobolus stellatus (strain SS14) TaxID=990650 RepID=A0A0C9UTX1_SPHS4|nr:hypothetical protein M422DRAFT_270046 [Sphaerobolus stellatus SS14]
MLFAQFTTNTFTLSTSTLTQIGNRVSPLAALFNHSCRPNAVMVFPRTHHPSTGASGSSEPSLHVIIIRDIEPDEEVLTSYVDISLPTHKRQEDLKEIYNFTSSCAVCSGTGNVVDPREIIMCPSSCGGVCPAPFNIDKAGKLASSGWCCTSCKASYAISSIEDIEDKRRLGQDALDKVTKLQFSAELSRLLAVDEPATSDISSSPSDSTSINTPSQTFPPTGPPRLALAFDALKRAYSELLIGFGESTKGGETGAHIRDELVSLEKEISVWKDVIMNVRKVWRAVVEGAEDTE